MWILWKLGAGDQPAAQQHEVQVVMRMGAVVRAARGFFGILFSAIIFKSLFSKVRNISNLLMLEASTGIFLTLYCNISLSILQETAVRKTLKSAAT